jgi:hypothetical protein
VATCVSITLEGIFRRQAKAPWPVQLRRPDGRLFRAPRFSMGTILMGVALSESGLESGYTALPATDISQAVPLLLAFDLKATALVTSLAMSGTAEFISTVRKRQTKVALIWRFRQPCALHGRRLRRSCS